MKAEVWVRGLNGKQRGEGSQAAAWGLCCDVDSDSMFPQWDLPKKEASHNTASVSTPDFIPLNRDGWQPVHLKCMGWDSSCRLSESANYSWAGNYCDPQGWWISKHFVLHEYDFLFFFFFLNGKKTPGHGRNNHKLPNSTAQLPFWWKPFYYS